MGLSISYTLAEVAEAGINSPPQWESVPTITFYEGTASTAAVDGYVDDFDFDALTISKTAGSLPTGVTYNPTLKRYEYDGLGGIDGSDGHVLTADDGQAELPPYRVSDMITSGPNSTKFNSRLDLAWLHAAGDWSDANQTSQGSTPYATTAISSVGLKTWNVATLVSRWLSNGLNRGFYLRGSGTAFTFDFSGRLNATVADRPKLTVVTNVNTYDCPCLASAWWEPSSATPKDGTLSFRVASTSRQAIVQFDLSAVSGTVVSATLQLYCSLVGASGSVVVFEADPPTPQVGGDNRESILGLAANYVFDQGIDADPDVIFATDFPNANVWEPEPISNFQLAYTTFPADTRTQSNYLSSKVPAGDLNGAKLLHYTMRGTTNGSAPSTTETELYFRYYVMLENGWGSDVDSNKMPGFDARMGWWSTAAGGTWNILTGNGGDNGDGKKYVGTGGRFEYQGHSMRGHGGSKAFDGHVYDDIFALRQYMYHLDFPVFGEEFRWGNFCIAKNRWHCIEQYCKMNSLTGAADGLGNRTPVADGIYRTWVDGVLAWEKTDFKWRCHPEIGIQGIWMEFYHGGTTPPNVDLPFRWNHVVVARSYIGPRRPV